MAKLPPPSNTGNPFADQIGDDLAPTGTHVATILDVKDEFGVQRQKFESVDMETVDLTCFLLGFRDQQGLAHRVASKRMRISGNEKSALFGFLKGLLGRAPEIGYDYCDLNGSRCLVSVEHVQRKNGSGAFAAVAALSPLPVGYADTAPGSQQSADHSPSDSAAPSTTTTQAEQTAQPQQPSSAPVEPAVAAQAAADSSAGEEIPF